MDFDYLMSMYKTETMVLLVGCEHGDGVIG